MLSLNPPSTLRSDCLRARQSPFCIMMEELARLWEMRPSTWCLRSKKRRKEFGRNRCRINGRFTCNQREAWISFFIIFCISYFHQILIICSWNTHHFFMKYSSFPWHIHHSKSYIHNIRLHPVVSGIKLSSYLHNIIIFHHFPLKYLPFIIKKHISLQCVHFVIKSNNISATNDIQAIDYHQTSINIHSPKFISMDMHQSPFIVIYISNS